MNISSATKSTKMRILLRTYTCCLYITMPCQTRGSLHLTVINHLEESIVKKFDKNKYLSLKTSLLLFSPPPVANALSR